MGLAILFAAPIVSLYVAFVTGRWVYRDEIPRSMVAFVIGITMFNSMLSIFTKILDYVPR